MVRTKCEIVVNDVLEELNEENKRLFEELLFANKCLKVLNEFKNFVELNSNQFKLILENKKRERYEELSQTVRQVLDEKLCHSKNFNDNIIIEVKREENSFEDNESEVKTSKKSRNNIHIFNETSCDSLIDAFADHYSDDSSTSSDSCEESAIESDNDNEFACDRPDCRFTTFNKRYLQKHIRRHDNPNDSQTQDSAEYQFVCHYTDCGKRFKQENNLNFHLWIHQRNDSQPNDTEECAKSAETNTNEKRKGRPKGSAKKQFICDQIGCGQRLASHKRLLNHLWQHQRTDDKKDKRYVCHYPGCDREFNRKYRLDDHVRTHTGETPFKCNHCDKGFASRDKQMKHELTFHKLKAQPLVCGIDGCDRQFNAKMSLNRHQKVIHLKEKPFVCDQPDCHYRTAFKELLQRHCDQKHTNDQRFQCPLEGCGKVFKVEYYLTEHMRRHSNNTIQTCPHEGCHKVLKSKLCLISHLKIMHSTAEWMTCDWPGCDYKTKRQQCLNAHSANHTSDYTVSCIWPNCDKKFKTNKRMTDHLRAHKNCKKIVCPWPGCTQKFKKENTLDIHMKTKHK